ncbi:MAG: FAD-dependent oxidoreductase [Eubacteriales bacterium]|nr:FAD-dependent oxidoreductase [Eubacteriales bacterium]
MRNYDVCVIGGSCTGVFAAIRAAEDGYNVCIIESSNCFGGTATAGFVNIWHTFYDAEYKTKIIGGLSQEVVDLLAKKDAVIETPNSPHRGYTFDSEQLKFVLDRMVIESEITPYLHTSFYDAETEGNKITSITVGNKDGLFKIGAKFFIDATGDGDLCRRVGIESYYDEAMQPPTMCARLYGIMPDQYGLVSQTLREHGDEMDLGKDWGWRGFTPGDPRFVLSADNHVFNVNCANADDLTYAEIEGRRRVEGIEYLLKKYIDSKIQITALPSYIGIRETYHIKSMHQANVEDILYGKRFEDAVINGSYRVDYHHADTSGITFKYLDGTQEVIPEAGAKMELSRWREPIDVDPTLYQLPYGALVPASKLENILMAGRMIDADREAFSALRVMVNCNQMGEAAGQAAAIALHEGIRAKDVSTKDLRSALSHKGAIII